MSDLDLFERQLSDRLHAHDLPDKLADLAGSSARRGIRIRRRRQAGVGVLLAAVLVVPGALLTTGRDRTDSVPVATVGAPTRGAGPSTIDPVRLPGGPAPTVDYVVDGVWHRADGSRVTLTAAERSDGAVSWVPYGDHLFVSRDRAIGNDGTYSVDSGPELSFPVSKGDTAAVAYPGPDGSVMAPTDHALLVLASDGHWRRTSHDGGSLDNVVVPKVSRNHVWTSMADSSNREVVQRPSLDSGAVTQRFPQWEKVSVADPVSDQVVLAADDDTCNEIVDGSTGVSRWRSCDWVFRSFSPDGHYVVATGASGTAFLDIRTRSVIRSVPLTNVVPGTYHFGADDGLSAVITDPGNGNAEAIASCDLSGACWQATGWYRDHPMVIVSRES